MQQSTITKKFMPLIFKFAVQNVPCAQKHKRYKQQQVESRKDKNILNLKRPFYEKVIFDNHY